MKKFTSMLCVLSICLSSIVALASTDDETYYTSEGGQLRKDVYGSTIYIDPDNTARYSCGINREENRVTLWFMRPYELDIVVPETVDGIPVVSVSGLDAINSPYKNNEKLESIVFPSTCEKISCFYNFSNLKKVVLPENLKQMDERTFEDCISLESIEIPGTLEVIPANAFRNCKSLAKLKLNEGLLSIKTKAFYGTAIDKLDLPETLEGIGEYAFSKTKNLESLRVPNKVERIANGAFSGSGLKTVEFANEALQINPAAFGSCEFLTEVKGLSKEKITECWNAFGGTPWRESVKDEQEPYVINKSGDLLAYTGSDTDIVVPDGVKRIVKSAFMNGKITSLVLPNSLERIEDYAFYGCKNLESLTIPESVTQIGSMAFSNCFNLKEITFEDGEKGINLAEFAFQFSAVTKETVHKNNRKISNFDAALKNTALDPDEAPIQTPTPTEQPTVKPTEQPTQTPTAKPTEEPSQTPVPTPSPQPQEKEKIEVVSEKDKIKIFTDEKEIEFTDAFPFIDENGRTQIPIRAVGEALGCEVLWEETERMVRLKKENLVVTITIDSNKMTADEKTIEMDTTAVIIDERTYIPLRFAGEALGFGVVWKEK